MKSANFCIMSMIMSMCTMMCMCYKIVLQKKVKD